MPPEPSPDTLSYGSVCSGIEAVTLAWTPLGLRPSWFAETAPFPCAVLAHRYPSVPNLGDMTRVAADVRAERVHAPDILVGGTPCQSFSLAGERRGLDDPRGALTLAYVELANAIDQRHRKNRRAAATLIWENVPGVLSDRGNAFGHFLASLAGERHALEPPGQKWAHAGYVSGPRRRIAWRVLDAQFFGLAQRRRRVFLVASGRTDLDPAQVLFERQGLCGDSAAGDAPWQSASSAAGTGAAPDGHGGLRSAYDLSSTRTQVHGLARHARAACLMAAGPRHDGSTETFLVQSVSGARSHTLSTANNGKGCGEDGTGRGVPVVAQAFLPAAFALNGRDELRLESGHGQLVGALTTGGGKPGQGHPMVFGMALHGRGCDTAAGSAAPALPLASPFPSSTGDKGDCLRLGYQAHLRYEAHQPEANDWSQWRVRRRMPVECERLQGLPDDWTRVPYRGQPAADAPRYRAIGNSMAVPCLAWLGRRLRDQLQIVNGADAD